jgi:putative flippase GtrA
VRFAVVGLANTGIDIALFAGLVWGMGWHVVPANLVAFAVAAFNSYVMNRLWTFAGAVRRPARHRFALFGAVTCGAAVAATAALWAMTSAGLPTPVAKILSVGVSISFNYVGMSRIVFVR